MFIVKTDYFIGKHQLEVVNVLIVLELVELLILSLFHSEIEIFRGREIVVVSSLVPLGVS